MLRIWDARDVECSGCGMFGMWDVRDVGCLGGGMWDVVCLPGCSECGMFGMWDVDLQNAIKEVF